MMQLFENPKLPCFPFQEEPHKLNAKQVISKKKKAHQFKDQPKTYGNCKAIYIEFAFTGWYTTLSTKECESTSP